MTAGLRLELARSAFGDHPPGVNHPPAVNHGDPVGPLLFSYVRGHTQLGFSLSQAESRTGASEREWDDAYGVMLEDDFSFGLDRILDGVQALIDGRTPAGPGR